jgi:hypothetical protein
VGFLKWGIPKTMGFNIKIVQFWMVWVYHHFRKPPYIYILLYIYITFFNRSYCAINRWEFTRIHSWDFELEFFGIFLRRESPFRMRDRLASGNIQPGNWTFWWFIETYMNFTNKSVHCHLCLLYLMVSPALVDANRVLVELHE